MNRFIALLAAMLAFLNVRSARATKNRTFFGKRPWYGELVKWAAIYGIPLHVAESLVKQESGGKENALGTSGEVGLLQLKRGVAIDFERVTGGPIDIGHPGGNLQAGLWYLSWLRDTYRLSMHDALLAYNSGIGNFQKGRIQNREYASQVLERAETLLA